MHDLNPNEVEALRILWQIGPSKPAEIQAEFGWSIANATLRSVLRGLVEKRVLVREKQGKAFYYRPRVTRRSQLRRTIQRMAEVFSGGSTGDLMLELIRSEKLTAEELTELQRIAAGKPSDPRTNTGGGDV
jgi:predicted transcriptional regulator